MMPENLRTARLTLRPICAQDCVAVVAALNNIDVTRWMRTVPFPYSNDDFAHFLDAIAVAGGDFVIEDDAGFCGLVGLDDGREFGYWLDPKAQGKGYVTEASETVLKAAFDFSDTPVRSGYFVGNKRSARVLEKLGFEETHRSDELCVAQGRALPHVALTLDVARFQAARQRVSGR